jgi:hypothetical protein
MPKLSKYHTGLISTDYHRFPDFPYKGRGWLVTLRKMPGNFYPHSSEVSVDAKGRNRIYEGKEIVIQASSLLTAQRAVNLIHSSFLLLDGCGFLLGTERGVFAVKPGTSEMMDAETQAQFRGKILNTQNLPLACLIGAKASFKREYSYALAKLRLSYEMHSVPWVYLSPYRSPNIPKSPYPEHQVRFAYGVILAYSILEEIGLEIRSGRDKPSRINGQWNPVVKEDLEQRLQKAGIDASEHFVWSIRGSATKLEKTRSPKAVSKTPWSKYQVRDVMIELIDAIAHVSWLRSKVSAHKLDPDLVKVLSAYDVANAQLLARRLLLGKMGVWRYFEQSQ